MYDLLFIIGWGILGVFGWLCYANSFRLFTVLGVCFSIGIPILIFLYSNMTSAVDDIAIVSKNYFIYTWKYMITTGIGFVTGSIIFVLLKLIKNR